MMLNRSVSAHPVKGTKGFTLVELMLVIVIMSIFAAMVVMSITGVDHRRLMQQREQLINDLSVIRLESMDQSRVFALLATTTTATQEAGYVVAEYQSPELQTARQQKSSKVELDFQNKAKLWQPASEFKSRQFSDGAYLQIKGLGTATRYGKNNQNQALLGRESPDLIWYGNGEVKPVRLQLIKDNLPIGEPIYINSLGIISNTENGGGV
jgi:general secretion pathway protein G